MRLLYLIVSLVLAQSAANAQSSIVSLTVSPTNPTSTDTIYVYAALMFPNSDCPLDNKGHTLNGNTILASSLHCQGMLTAICNTTDTFKIDPLAAGTYTFDLTLSGGMGGPPCSPPFVADDNDTITFVVVNSTAGIGSATDFDFSIFPNPATSTIILSKPLEEVICITASDGRIVQYIDPGQIQIDITSLAPGSYFLTNSNVHYKFVKL